MSIAIIAMKENFAVVATDSRNTRGDGTFTQVPKIYKCNDDVVAFGVGSTGIYKGYFDLLANCKSEITYSNAVSRLQYWRTFVKANKQWSTMSSIIGICGFPAGSPEATMFYIGERPVRDTVMRPEGGSALCILPPPELTSEECNEIFKHASQDVARSTRKCSETVQYLRACQRTIAEVSRRTQSVDDTVQYWGRSIAPRYLKFYMPISQFH